jgi:hypothetical protein
MGTYYRSGGENCEIPARLTSKLDVSEKTAYGSDRFT